MRVYEAIADAFVGEGTAALFGMMGDANMHWINALSQRGVPVFEVRHEGSGLGMAEGWARASGRVGVATTTSGPGVSQLATSMVVAARGHVPLVVFCGETPTGDLETAQYFDAGRFASAVECDYVHVSRADLAHEAVRRAFYVARTASRPVIVSAPTDIQQLEFDDEPYQPSHGTNGTARRAPDDAQVARAIEIIRSSAKPVIIAGRGAQLSGAGDAILHLQQQTGATLATTVQTKNWLRERSPHFAGISGLLATRAAIELFQEADCVIAVGASLNPYTIEHGYLYPEATFVQIDTDPARALSVKAAPVCFLEADALAAVTAISDRLGSHTVGVWAGASSTAAPVATPPVDASEYVREPARLDPREALAVIDELLPERIGGVLGNGHQADFGAMFLSRPRRFITNYGVFGAIGQAALLTIGAVAAHGQPTFVIDGDGSFMMHLQEFETACRYALPVLMIVMNDQGLGAEYHKSRAASLDPELVAISTPELGDVAAALGGRGSTVRTVADLRAALEDYLANPSPTVIDVRTSRQVVSIPYRRLAFGEDV